MAVTQAVLAAFDLAMPFLSLAFINYGAIDFFMAYGFAVLDILLVIGFLRGDRWAWFFGLLYTAMIILSYAFLFYSNPTLLYAFPLVLRLFILFALRSKKNRAYFDTSRTRI